MLVGNNNRNRVTIEQPGNPRLYQDDNLPFWALCGTVSLGDKTGALVRNKTTGHYAMANAGDVCSLDQRKVLAALGKFANAKKLHGGRPVTLYLDAASLERAAKLGDGNISAGIRQALELAQKS